MQHDADVNAKVTGTKMYSMNVSRAASNNEGTTALHTAAQAGKPELVKYLLDKGANPNVLDANGKKPIELVGVRAGAAGSRRRSGSCGGERCSAFGSRWCGGWWPWRWECCSSSDSGSIGGSSLAAAGGCDEEIGPGSI